MPLSEGVTGGVTNGDAAVRFADERRALTLLAQALSGQRPLLHGADEAAARSAAPGGSWETPWRIALPASIARHPNRTANRAAYRLAVLQQVVRLESGGADFDLDGWLLRWPRRALLRQLFLLLEGARVARLLLARYPGAAPDLERERTLALGRRPPLAGLSARRALLERLVRWSLQVGAGTSEAPVPLPAPIEGAARVLAAGATAADSASVAAEIARRLGVLKAPEAAAPGGPAAGPGAAATLPLGASPPDADDLAFDGDGDGEDLRSLTCDLDDWSLQLDTASLPRLASAGHGRRIAIAATDPAVDGATGGDATPAADTPPRTLPRRRAAAASARRCFVDEWDYRRAEVRRHWCTIVESRPAGGGGGAFVADLQRRHGAAARALARRFAALRLAAPAPPERADDGDEINLDLAVARAAERRAGHSDPRSPYLRRPWRRREVCAAFLLDTSASTDFVLPDADAPPRPPVERSTEGGSLYDLEEPPPPAPPLPRRRVIDLARDALALMSQALQALGDSHGIYAFDGDGRDHVRFQVVKEIDEPHSARSFGALAALRPQGATRTGAAVRHAAAKLGRHSAARKLLFVITDGYPEDSDYGGPPRDLDYGLHDTARALEEAEAAGIATFCIAIDHAGHDYLQRLCPPRRRLAVDRIETLPERLGDAYLALRRRRA